MTEPRAMAEDARAAIATFLEMLASERGAARNTLDAYRRDLAEFARYLAGIAITPARVTPATITDYMRLIGTEGLAPASRARRLSAPYPLSRYTKRFPITR